MSAQQLEFDTAVVCLSGGMDSTSLLLHLLASGCHVRALSFDYGQKHRLEIERLKANLDYLKANGIDVDWQLLDISAIGNLFHSALLNDDWNVPQGHYEQDQMKATVVPNRNAIFASLAFGYALSIANKNKIAVGLCLGVHSGDHAIYPDCRPEFYEAIYNAFQLGNWDADQVHLYLPYLNLDKHQILVDAQSSIAKLGLDFNTIFRNTLTSYAPDASGKSHGITGSDVERILAFAKLGIADPIDYRDPWDVVVARAWNLKKIIVSNLGLKQTRRVKQEKRS